MSNETQNPAPVRVGKLETDSDIHRELARLYRACRRGDVPAKDGSHMAAILAELRNIRHLSLCDH